MTRQINNHWDYVKQTNICCMSVSSHASLKKSPSEIGLESMVFLAGK